MENRGANSLQRIGDPRSRRQRRYAAAMSQHPSPQTITVDPNSAAQFPNFRGRISGAIPPQSHLQRHRLRRQRDGEGFGTVQEAVNDLDNDPRTRQLNSAALNQTLPIPIDIDELNGAGDRYDGQGRRSKRRKHDADHLDTLPKINYGYHGQVAPGRLKMMISWCDGGELHNDGIYSKENILRNDMSVYCSKKSMANLMLSHWGEIPFSCTKIVIKTPNSGFPAPVQEGMVFLFMDRDHMLETTSQFYLMEQCPHRHQNSTPPPDPPRYRARPRMHPGPWLAESGEDQPSPRSFPLGSLPSLDLEGIIGNTALNYRPGTASSQEDMPPLTRVPRRRSLLHTTSSYHEHIDISCDPPSGDEEEASTEAVLDDRRRRGQQVEINSEDEEEELHYTGSYRTGRQMSKPRSIQWLSRDASSSTANDHKPPGPDVPYKRFFIERKKYVVTIRFDPPVSGKHILLKMWSPPGRDSLDLQGVSVYGFAGPRFFPVLATR